MYACVVLEGLVMGMPWQRVGGGHVNGLATLEASAQLYHHHLCVGQQLYYVAC